MLVNDKEFERQWAEITKARKDNFAALVKAGAVPATDLGGVHRSNDDVIVGTVFESLERQRGGLRFTDPTSRRAVLQSLRS